MYVGTLRCLLCSVVVLGMNCVLFAQDPPKPGPEHEMLAKLAGTWETVSKIEGAPDSKGKAAYKVECGGLWLASTFDGEFGGIPFQGKGLDSYDPKKKKFVSVWVDSMSTTPMLFEGDYDKASRKTTLFSEYPGPDGKPAKFKSVTTFKDDDHHTFQLFFTPEGGQESLMLTMDYTRKK